MKGKNETMIDLEKVENILKNIEWFVVPWMNCNEKIKELSEFGGEEDCVIFERKNNIAFVEYITDRLNKFEKHQKIELKTMNIYITSH